MKRQNRKINNKISFGHRILSGVLCLLALCLIYNIFIPSAWSAAKKKTTHRVFAPIAPKIPQANRNQKNRIFLEHADHLIADEYRYRDVDDNTYQVLVGSVKFRKGGMYMYCDSAHFYELTNSLDAFGHVKMEQGDTLFVYSDVLYYNGNDELAQLRYNVKLENRDTRLYTDSLDYDMLENLGYYFDGGRIEDSKNDLSSVYGEYYPDTKKARFLYDVELINEKYILKTDTLHYNTASHIADIVGMTTIVSDSNIIYTNKGWYNTEVEEAELYNRSLLVGKDGNTLTGDTVYYDRDKGVGRALGNMILTDSVHSSIIDGDYGYHDENKSYSFATKRARAREFSQGDTLYLHADTISTFLFDEDSTRVMTAAHKVRFFRKDVQGICDSMSMAQRDSIMNMYHHAIIWNENHQISGNEINVHIQDSTVDWAKLPDFGFIVEHIDDVFFNQMKGKEMKAYFKEGEMRQLDVSGNVEVLMYPMENDSTYNKLVTAESSFMTVLLKPKQEVEKISMWPDVSGDVVPLFLAKRSQYYLEGFKWQEAIRPKDPDDIFIISDQMNELLNETEQTSKRRRKVNK